LAFKVVHLQEAVNGIRALNLKGVSVTIPHKIEVMDYLDDVEKVAQRIGAVNTVLNQEGRLIGHNTDCGGAIRALEEKIELKGKKAMLIGAGGAARAIAFGLKEKGADIIILNRTVKKAEMLASELDCHYGGLARVESFTPDVLINTTSLGMYPKVDDIPVRKEFLKDMLVFDIVYNPLKTRLIREAEQSGCDTILGVEMFVNQAALQFEIWTGKEAPLELMRNLVVEELS
jgi:shikimate dehydrogenase